MRHTRSQTRSRRSHHALDGVAVVTNKETGALSLAHRVDESTGMYRGRQIFVPKVKLAKGSKEAIEAKAAAAAERHHDHAAEAKSGSKGILGKIAGASRPKARSGMGGQAS